MILKEAYGIINGNVLQVHDDKAGAFSEVINSICSSFRVFYASHIA